MNYKKMRIKKAPSVHPIMYRNTCIGLDFRDEKTNEVFKRELDYYVRNHLSKYRVIFLFKFLQKKLGVELVTGDTLVNHGLYQQKVSELLCMSRQTLTRIYSELRKEGFHFKNKGFIKIKAA